METNFNFKSSICTSREQSERLLALGLKKETADMYITNMSRKGLNYTDDWQIGSISYCDVMSFWDSKKLQLEKTAWSIIPAWSLDRLKELYKGVGDTSLWNLDDVNYDRLIQCIGLAIKHNDFNKEYLENGNC